MKETGKGSLYGEKEWEEGWGREREGGWREERKKEGKRREEKLAKSERGRGGVREKKEEEKDQTMYPE